MGIVKWFSGAAYKNKLIISFSVIILTSILFVGLYNYIQTSGAMKKEIEKSNAKILREVNLNLERYFHQYEQIFFNISTSSEFKKWLLVDRDDILNTSLIYRHILERYIDPIISIYPEIITINLLNSNGNENTYYLKTNVLYRDGYSVGEDDWIKSIPLVNKTFVATVKNSHYEGLHPEDLYAMRFARKFVYSSNTAAGFIEFDVSLQPILEILGEMKYSKKGEGMILDESGLIMAHTDVSRINTFFDPGLFNSSIKGRENGLVFHLQSDRVIIFSTIRGVNWKSVAVIPYSAINEGMTKLWTLTVVVICLSIVLCIFIVIVISSSLTRRIEALNRSIRQTGMNRFKGYADIKGNDEIAELAVAYNTMLKEIDRYIQELAETRLLQQQTVLSALQSQINSHFLYNTLEVVNSMAYIAGHKEIRKVVAALSKMLRYTSSYRDTVVTVRDEVGHMEDYLEIMKIQMGDNIHYKLDIDEEILDVPCLKAIMQPIVENSIKHGIEPTGRPGYIHVKAGYLGERHISIEILDDGKGFEPEKLEEVRKQFEALEYGRIGNIARVGLVNVNYRLKVFYRSDGSSGVFVENRAGGKGSAVRIVFALESKEADYV